MRARITIYDVMDYWKKGWSHDQIAGLFRLPPDDVQEAIRYIERHRDEVLSDYQAIIDRHRNHAYPPETKDKLRRSHERFQARLPKSNGSRNMIEGTHARDHGGS